jgi:hypothetical protein
MTTRREFVRELGLGALTGAALAAAPQDAPASGTSGETLPSVPFGPHRITRLIVGGNPFVANSHLSRGMNEDMASYFTPEEVVRTLQRCEAAGINTLQARGDYHRILYWLELFRRAGGRLNFIAQTASEMHDVHQNIRIMASAGAIATYLHGTRTDRFWQEGGIDKAQDYLKTIRDTGMRVGLASHIPEVFDYVESKGWDLDFYMVPFYNLALKPAQNAATGGKFEEEVFDPADPPRFCRFIRSTGRQCLAYKVLAASRRCADQEQVRETFRWTYANIKPQDCVVVGMFPKYEDQPALNVRHAIEAIRAAGRG